MFDCNLEVALTKNGSVFGVSLNDVTHFLKLYTPSSGSLVVILKWCSHKIIELLPLRLWRHLWTTTYLKKATVDCSAAARTVRTGIEQKMSDMIQMMKTETVFTFRWILLYFRGNSRLSSLRVVSSNAWRHVEVLRMFGTSHTASSFHFARLPNWLVKSAKDVY